MEIPPSLENIYKELHDDLGCKIPNNGYLVKWAKQGVLLLNTVLTVRAHQANSHQNIGWEQFTDAVIEILDQQDRPMVFLLWGQAGPAEKGKAAQPEPPDSGTPHPVRCPLTRGFQGCRHFSKTNQFLEEHGLTPIDWQIEDVPRP